MQASSVNSSLRVLRRVLRLANEWGVITSAPPKIKLLRGETKRERVITADEEARYLAVAGPLMTDIAIVLSDTGLRPEENARLRWERISWSRGKHGALEVTHGKTAAARRTVPLTPRVLDVLSRRWAMAGHPLEGWVWSATTKSGHIEPSTWKKQHAKTLKLCGVKPFVLYSFRHTFLTRLGEAGCDAWTLARVAGHSSISMSARYVHPSDDAVTGIFARLEPRALPTSKPQ